MRTLSEIRTRVKNDTRETTLADSYLNDWVNLTLQEINDPAWAFEQIGRKGIVHNWSFNRRKHPITTVANTEDYQLPRDLDKIGLVRQTTTPIKLIQVPDNLFYRFIPNPTATGNPRYYRLWQSEGLSTSLDADDTIDVVSDNAADTTQTLTVAGYDTNGIRVSEEYTLNGTTVQNGSTTFDSGRPIRVSKSGSTAGNITVTEHSGGTTLLVMGAEERSPRFKIISFYPIPSSAITIYLEYYTRIRLLVNDSDVADIDEKWMWIVVAGVKAKVYQYQNKESMFNSAQALYASGVRSMVASDMEKPDLIEHLTPHRRLLKAGILELADDTWVPNW